MSEASSGELWTEHVQQAVLAFIGTQTWVASRAVMRAEQNDLFAPEADDLLAELLTANKDNTAAVATLTRLRSLLADAKREGIDTAYADLITPRYIASLQDEMQSLPAGDDRHIEVVRALLELVDGDDQKHRAHLQMELGKSLAYSGDTRNLTAAIELLEQAAGTLESDAEEQPQLWAALQLHLANAIVKRAGRAELAGDAIEHYEAALRYFDSTASPLARSISQRIALLRTTRANVAPDLNARLADLLRASELMQPEADPEKWARLQHNLGESYRQLSAGGESANGERAIEHLSSALEVFTESRYPVDFGLAANSLGAAYLYRVAGERSDNIELALANLHAALRVRPRDKYPDFWAKTQVNLGNAYMARIDGDRDENIAAAIRHLSAPLDDSAGAWFAAVRGHVERELADAYLKLSTGERPVQLDRALQHARNAVQLLGAQPAELAKAHWVIGTALSEVQSRGEAETEEAIEHFELGLSLPADVNPLARAKAEQSLAILYEYRSTGEKSANQIKAIEHYQAAYELYDGADVAVGTATCQYWIGCVFRKRVDLPEPERLSIALEYLRAAFDRFPPDAPASVRIDIQLELSDALIDLSAGDRGENIEIAIGHLQDALSQLDSADPRRSNAHSALGVALLEWRGGERAENLERAIEQQRAVLALVTRESDPRSWALAHHNLGNVYNERPLGDRAQNIEDAIGHFNAALEVFTQEATPDEWAMVHNSLGGAYGFRIRGDRSENIEQALNHYDQTLKVYTQQAYPADWAMTLHNLGNAYMQRIQGYEPQNIENAIRALETSLVYRTRQALPFFWAMTHSNLGTAYAKRSYGEQLQNLRQAVQHYRLALEVYTKEASPTNWAWVQHMLGSLSSKAGLSTEERIEHLTAALEEYRQHTHPERWALTHNNLALIYSERPRPDPIARQKAIEHLQLALQALTPDAFPQHYRAVHINLADEYLLERDWRAALDSYQLAIDVGETLLAAAYSEHGRLEEASRTSRLYTHAAYCLLQLGDIERSIVQLDAGRTRQLAEGLARSHADLDRLPPPLRERLQQARQTLDELEAAMRVRDEDLPVRASVDLNQLQHLFPNAPREHGSNFTLTTLTLSQARVALGAHGLRLSFADQARDARQNLDAVVREARAIVPDFMHAGIDAKDIIALVPVVGALVAFMLTPAGSAAIVIPHGAERVDATHALALDDDADNKVHQLLGGTVGGAGWINAYAELREQMDFTGWQETIESTTQALWDIVIGPIQGRLESLGLGHNTPVILMPQSTLALLPVHAAWREVDGRPRSFLDDHAVSYAPSLFALQVGQRQLREPARMHRSLLAVVDPTQDLPYAAEEGAAVASHFAPEATSTLAATDATETAVVAGVRGASYLHFATHGEYDWRDVMRSHLLLAEGSKLTLARVMSTDFDLGAARLVVLSACETALTDIRRAPDEFLGLPAGFMEGGAPGVVSALWPINDLSTGLLLQEFYRRHIHGGEDVASALRGAQLWLRDSTTQELALADHWERIYAASDPPDGYAFRMMHYCRANPDATPYAATYYWAAFTFSGA